MQTNFSIKKASLLCVFILIVGLLPFEAHSTIAGKSISLIDSIKAKIDINVRSTSTDTCQLLNDLLVLATEHQKKGEYKDALKVVRYGQAFKKMACERYGYMYLMEGLMQYHLGRKDSALLVFSNALDYALENSALKRDIHLYLGLVQVRSGYQQKAVDNFRLSAKYSKASNNNYTLLQSYSNSGVAHYNLGNLDSSLHFHKLSLKSNKGECVDCKLNSLTSIGILFDEQGKLDSATLYFNKVLEYENKDIVYRGVFLVPHLSVGVIHYKKGSNKAALEHLQKALVLIKEYNDQDHENLIQVYTYLGAVYSSMTNPILAAKYYDKSSHVMDSVQNERLIGATAEAESKFQVKESLLQTELLAKENSLHEEKLGFQRTVILSSCMAIVVVSIFLIVVVLQRRKLSIINTKLQELIKEKDHFMGMLTHDLRTPVSSIIGVSDELKSTLPKNIEGTELLDEIRKSGLTALILMNDILDIYRFESTYEVSKGEMVNLSNCANHIANRYESLAVAKKQSLNRQIEPDVFINSNAALIKSILGNLISNALKYTPINGYIKITVKEDNEAAIIKIEDSGPGFTLEDQSKVFLKFQTLSALPTGGEDSTGLGLYMVKVMVEKIGGSIELQENTETGATFIISLPK